MEFMGMPMGRLTRESKRTKIQDYMKKMRGQFRTALKDDDLQEAFDELWPTWSSEMAAMIYAEILSVMDLLLLTATMANRKEIMKLRTRIMEFEEAEVALLLPTAN